MAVECVVHVGAGKCGSSSLQAHLSETPRITADDGKQYEYMCLKANCRVLTGSTCQTAAATSAYGYGASVSVRRFFTPDYQRLRDRISNIADGHRIPVFSYEGWINENVLFNEWNVLEKLGLEASVVIFIRPQVDWINSSWWQWGAWSKESFTRWLHRWKEKGCWAKAASLWRQVPGVREIRVFTTADDVVTTFFRCLNAPSTLTASRKNLSLDGNVLRFLQQHKELRSGRRQSAMHAILGRHLPSGPVPVPWVLKRDLIADLIEFYREDNKRLLALVDEKTKAEISEDPRWWEFSAYSDKLAERPGALPPHAAQVEDVAARSIRAILDLDQKLRGR